MIPLPLPYLRLALAAAALSAAAAAGWTLRGWRADGQIEALRAVHAAAVSRAASAALAQSERARNAELALGRKVEDEALKGRAAALAMDRERAAGRAALRSVRDRHGAQLAAAVDRASSAASTACGGSANPPGSDAVLAELWSAAEEAVVLAGWLDRAIDRGLRCERLYNAARQQAIAAGEVKP